MTDKTFDENEIKKIASDLKYKYIGLRDANGGVKVPYNTAKGSPTKQLDEAFKRLPNMPDGIYYFYMVNSKGRNIQPDVYPYVKGNVTLEEKGTVPIIINPGQQQKPTEELVLSNKDIVDLKTELAEANLRLEAAEKENEDLKKEIDETPEMEEGDPSTSATSFLEQAASSLLPVFDRYMNYKEKRLALDAKKLNGKPRRRKSLPPLNSPEFQQWCDRLEVMPDAQFQRLCENLAKYAPEHYQAVIEEFSGMEEEEEEIEEVPGAEELNEENYEEEMMEEEEEEEEDI